MPTLGEQKETACAWCSATFAKKRYDQRFCSPICHRRGKNAELPPWKDRPNSAKWNARRMERYYANKDKELQKRRIHYIENKEEHAARTKAYRAAHPETRKIEYQNARQKRPWAQALAHAKRRSAKHNFAFNLTREWCEQNWTGRCVVSGLPFLFGTQHHFPFSPSIDRIRNDLGYTADNCRFVLFAVNNFKGTNTDEDMLLIAKAIIQNAGLPRP